MTIINPFESSRSPDAYPAIKLVKKDPKLAAMVSKLTTPRNDNQQRDDRGNRKNALANVGAFRAVLGRRAKRNADSASIMRLLPDVELSAQILISSILAPKDMTSVDLIYMGPKNIFSAELNASLLNRLKTHFEDNYKIKPVLSEMLRDALFEKGSYPVAVIPENAIDDFINGNVSVTMEAMRPYLKEDNTVRDVGVLGNYTKEESANSARQHRGVTMESFYRNPTADAVSKIDARVHYKDETSPEFRNFVAEEFLSVTDNMSTLKIPKLNARVRSEAIKSQYRRAGLGIAAESDAGGISDHKIERLLYRTRQQPTEALAALKKPNELKRRSIGNPLIMKWPSESVIPVHVPGDVRKHIGYFVLLDQEGNPIEVPDGDAYYSGLNSGLNGSGTSLASNLIRKVETNMGTGSNSFNPMETAHLDFASQVYSDMVERDLISRIKNGMYASAVALAKNEEVYRIMLSRVLSKKYTQILYVPIEYVTYVAFKYGDDGVGRSLMDDSSMINTLRSVMLFNDVLSSVKNSIGRTKVTVTLPENDPNPMKTMEMAQDEIVRSRMLQIPLGVSNPEEITSFIQRAGYEWEFNGHKGIPDIKFDFQQTQTQHQKTDGDLQELLKKASIMAIGLSPETVENGFNTEFATTAVANNILLGKRVMMHQETFMPQVSDHLRKVATCTADLVDDLRQMLVEKAKGIRIELDEDSEGEGLKLSEEIKSKLLVSKALHLFLSGFYVELPKPTSITLENQLTDLKTYSDALDVALDAYISGDFFTTDTAGNISNQASTIKAMIKAYFIRKWLSDKGVLPELAELTAIGEDGQPQLDFLKGCTEHVQALVRSGVTALASLQPIIQAGNKDLEKMGAGEGESSGGNDDSSNDDSSSSGDDFGGDDFGDGGFGDAATGDETGNAGTAEDPEAEGDAASEEDPEAEKETPEEPKPEEDAKE